MEFLAGSAGLQSVQQKSGQRDQPGAVSELGFIQGGRHMEKDTRNELPNRFAVLYEAKGVRNAREFEPVELGTDRTKRVSHQAFEFSAFMKIIGLRFRSAFPKQTLV